MNLTALLFLRNSFSRWIQAGSEDFLRIPSACALSGSTGAIPLTPVWFEWSVSICDRVWVSIGSLSVCLPFCQLATSAGRRQTASQLAIYEISNLISCFLFSSLPLRPSHLTLTLFCSCFINQSTSVQFRVFLLTPIKLLWISRSLTFEHRYRLNLPFQGV